MRSPRHHLRIILILLLLSLWWNLPASEAQTLVAEVGVNLVQNFIQAIQSVAAVANQVLDLTPLDDMIMESGEFMEDLEALDALVDEAQGLSWEADTLSAQYARLFGVEKLPIRSSEYALRRTEVAGYLLDGYHYSMRTQNLLKRSVHIVKRTTRFLKRIPTFIGNLQGSQNISESTQELTNLLTQANIQAAAFERAQATEGADQVSSQESLRLINKDVWGSWPGMTPR